MSSMQERLTARFLRYAAINSQSVEGAPVVPSTPGQRQLAELLKKEAWLFMDDGYIFGEAGEGFERWNLACPTCYIEAALPRLKKTLEAHRKS